MRIVLPLIVLCAVLQSYCTMAQPSPYHHNIALHQTGQFYQELEQALIAMEAPEQVTRLTLHITPVQQGLTVMPSGSSTSKWQHPELGLHALPGAIAKYKNLEALQAASLGLKALPPAINQLKALKSLDLSFNPIVIEHEMEKLLQLKQLQELYLYGIAVSSQQVQLLLATLPSVKLYYVPIPNLPVQQPPCPLSSTMETSITLLPYVHQYYPVGAPSATDWWPYYQKIDKIVQAKGHTTAAKGLKLPHQQWQTMAQEVATAVAPLQATNQMAGFFPSYQLLMRYPVTSQGDTSIRTSLMIHLSLLSPYYTLFFTESRSTKDYSQEPQRTYYGMESATASQQEVMTLVLTALEKAFPHHAFIPHKPLFTFTVSSVAPYGTHTRNDSSAYSLFRLLFGPDEAIGVSLKD